MNRELLEERLSELPLNELERLLCDQYETKEKLIQDIIDNDTDKSVEELMAQKGSFLDLFIRVPMQKRAAEQGAEPFLEQQRRLE